MLHAGAHAFVAAVVLDFPRVRFSAFRLAVRDDQPGARIPAVGDRDGMPDLVFRPGFGPRLAVVAVAGHRAADRDHQACVGVDDHLVVGGIAVVLRLLGHVVVAGGHEGAVHDQHGVLAEPPALGEGEQRGGVVDDPVGGGLGDAEQRRELAQRQVGAPVGRHQQHPVLQRQRPRTPRPRCIGPLPA